mgnify:CR=1 FL=1
MQEFIVLLQQLNRRKTNLSDTIAHVNQVLRHSLDKALSTGFYLGMDTAKEMMVKEHKLNIK